MLTDNDLEAYQTLNAAALKELLVKYNLPEKSTQAERKLIVKEYLEHEWSNLDKRVEDVTINFNQISPYLPVFQYFGSHDYGNPQALIKKTLDNIVTNHFYSESGQLKQKHLISAREKLLKKINRTIESNLLTTIKRYNSKIEGVRGRIDLSFGSGFQFNGLEVDEGFGFRFIDQKGEGSKKRLFFSILEWDKEVQGSFVNARPVIRAYDEPDSNLHYDAQRKMFYAISSTVSNRRANTQAIIATHSISMIDRAPSNCINHVIQKNGISTISFLKTNGDDTIQKFLNQIAVVGGIKNSSIFYEKCFLIVEGDSEEASMGKIYKRFFKRTLAEDGIVLVNLKSNGSWQNFLKLLNSNKKDVTVMLLDADTQNANSGASVTPTKLAEIGFDQQFLTNNVFFAGTQEFEDLYPDNRIRDTLNKIYPRSATHKWTVPQVRSIRTTNQKISKGLETESFKFIAHHKNRFKKPQFASEIIDLMTDNEIRSIPVLQQLFAKVQQVIM